MQIAPLESLQNVGEFDYICGTQFYLAILKEQAAEKFKKNQIFFNIKNLWDTTYDDVDKELELPSLPENVIGLLSVAHRLKFLEQNFQKNEVKNIGVFGNKNWLLTVYRDQGFTNDFENFKVLPIYPSGAYSVRYSLIIDKTTGLNHRVVHGKEVVQSYRDLLSDYPEDHFFAQNKHMVKLMLRENFLAIESRMKGNPIFDKVRFLDSYLVDSEETCNETSERLMKLNHNKYIIKPNISSSHQYAHTFKITKNDENFGHDALEALNFFQERISPKSKIIIQPFYENIKKVLKTYCLGTQIKIAVESTFTEEQLREMDETPEEDYINFEKHKNAKEEYNLDKETQLY